MSNFIVGDFKYSINNSDHYDWLLCDGRSLLRKNYYRLYRIIGTTYGSLSDNTFNLPNCLGRTLAGASDDYPVGTSIGEETHLLKTNEVPSHGHTGTTDINGIHNHGMSTSGFGLHSHGDSASTNIGSTFISDSGTYVNAHTHSFPEITNAVQSGNDGLVTNDAYGTHTMILDNGSTNLNNFTTDTTNSIHQHAITLDGYHNHFLTNDNGHSHQLNFNNNVIQTPHNNMQNTIFAGYVFILS